RLEVVLGPPIAQRERVTDDDPARPGHPGRLQHVGAGLVATADRCLETGRAQPPVARASVQDRAEDAGPGEPRHAEPLHRARGGDQRASMAVREKSVPGDPREARLDRGHGPRRLFGARPGPDLAEALSRITRGLDSGFGPGWCSASTPGFGPGSRGWNPRPG